MRRYQRDGQRHAVDHDAGGELHQNGRGQRRHDDVVRRGGQAHAEEQARQSGDEQ